MPARPCFLALLAVADVRHRIVSRVVERFDEWWQIPAVVLAAAAVAAVVIWLYRRDAAELRPATAAVLACLRLAALAAVGAAWLDIERIAEHEIVLPSRVAVLVDTSASMSLADAEDDATNRLKRAVGVLEEGGLLAALEPRHDVSLWRFDADAEPLAVIPGSAPRSATADAGELPQPGSTPPADWRGALVPQGYETRLGEGLARVLDREPAAALAAVIVLSDGGNNSGVEPAAAAAAVAESGVAVHAIGIGSDTLPANVRVADVVAPARIFPGDRFSVTGYLQPQGLEGERVRVELAEQDAAARRVIDTLEAVLPADGQLAPVRFDVAGLPTPGRRTLAVRVIPPATDRAAADDVQTADVEVVDRVTQVLLMAGGPTREYQFVRNLLERDDSFTVDVLLGTAAPGISQDARRILDAFPVSDEALAEYDAVVAFDFDWRSLDAAAQGRLERWVAAESGGLVLVAGPVFMEAWLAEPGMTAIRGLYPVELRRAGPLTTADAPAAEEPRRLEFTRDGEEAEFLWLADSRAASQTVWREFPGVYACFPTAGVKPGATVYARVARPRGMAAGEQPAYLVGQLYGAGSVFFLGSGELWRLRAVDDAAHERITTQLVRHVSQGRLLRGTRRGRLLVDRDRYPLGATVTVRLVVPETRPGPGSARTPDCIAIAPDGDRLPVPLVPEPARPGTVQGSFIASREGGWQIEVEPSAATGDERLTRRVQVQLPDRELARPRLDRAVLTQLSARSGGTVRFIADGAWSAEASRAVADAIPDRSRREYETGAPDASFKQRLNAVLLALGGGLLCVEWIIRRVVRLS
jgi:hypothetical protein